MSVDILVAVHVFIFGLRLSLVWETFFFIPPTDRCFLCIWSVPVTGKLIFSAVFRKCLYQEVCHTCTLLPFYDLKKTLFLYMFAGEHA